MSARLIKIGQTVSPQSLIPFSIPENGMAPIAASVAGINLHPQTDPLDAAGEEAHRIVANAQAEAARILSDARENAHRLVAAEVAQEVAKSVTPWQEQLAVTLEKLDGLGETMAARCERELVRLAIEIARKVVHREISVDNEIVMTLARIGLSRIHNRAPATILLHPDDLDYVTAHRDELGVGHAIELVEDRSIGRGGCVLRTEVGEVDARIEQQFAEIERAFLGY